MTADAGWPPRRFHKCILLDEILWVMGGCTNGSINLNDVWASSDGASWQHSNTPPWGVRHEFVLLHFQDKVWLLGGFSGFHAGLIIYNDIWAMQPE